MHWDVTSYRQAALLSERDRCPVASADCPPLKYRAGTAGRDPHGSHTLVTPPLMMSAPRLPASMRLYTLLDTNLVPSSSLMASQSTAGPSLGTPNSVW